MAEGKFDQTIPYTQWSSESMVTLPLSLIKRFLTQRFKRFQGPLRGTLWALDRMDVEPTVKTFRPRFSFSASDPESHVVKAGPQVTGYLHLERSEQTDPPRTGFVIHLRFHVRLERDGAVVAHPAFRIAFQGRPANHVLSLDLGATGWRIAVDEIARPGEPILEHLVHAGDSECMGAPHWWMVPRSSQADRGIDGMGPLRLGATLASWQIGFSGAMPEEAVPLPPAAVLPHLDAAFWQQNGIDQADLDPFCLLWCSLIHSFQKLHNADPERWHPDHAPGIAHTVMTLPGQLSASKRARMKTTLSHAIEACPGFDGMPGGGTRNPTSVHVMSQIDAAAADVAFRSPDSGGLGLPAVGTHRTILVFHLGASCCQASIVDFSQQERDGTVFPVLDVRHRLHLNLGGADMDRMISRLLFANAPAQSERGPKRDAFATARRRAGWARRVKETLSTAFYGRDTGQDIGSIVPQRPNARTHLDRLYDVMEHSSATDQARIREIQDAIAEVKTALSGSDMHLHFDPAPDRLPPRWSLASLVEDAEISHFLQATCRDFPAKLLDRLEDDIGPDPAVVLTGGMTAFPLVRETLLETLAKSGMTGPIRFPNRNVDCDALRQAVVFGAARAASSLPDLEDLVQRLELELAVLCFDQQRGRPTLAQMASQQARFQKRKEGSAFLSALVPGVRLRQHAQAPEILRIVALADAPDWNAQEAIDDLATAVFSQPTDFVVLCDEVVTKDGAFTQDDDRTVHLNLSCNGHGAVRLFPKTHTNASGRRSGDGTYRQFRLTPPSPHSHGHRLSTFPFATEYQ